DGSGPVATRSTSSSGLPPVGGLPVKGRGWDAKHVYIGIPTANDFDSVARAAGAQGSGSGSTEGDVNAIVADINRRGGLLGRQVVPVFHDARTTDIAYNSAATAQAMCTYFTQDRPVIGVINGVPQFDALPNFHACLEKSGVSLLTFSNTDFSDADYRRLGPHLWTVGSLSTDVLVPGFVSALERQGFFTGWDSLNGRAGAAAVRVGIMLPDSAQGHHVGTLMTAALKRIGLPVASSFYYNASGLGSDSQSEVLQFSAAKVTHVLDLPPVAAEIWFFQGAAEQQHYRPRYGFTSFDLPLSIEGNPGLAPAAQQVGSMGIGWQPYNDANAAHDPGATPGRKRCLDALAKGGQRFGGGDRRAALIASQFCDAIYLLVEASAAGRGFSSDAVLSGMPIAGPHLLTAGTFRSDLTSSNHGVPAFYRDQHYDGGCSCFVYTGGDHAFGS
ncbi:MAG: hypothetical protein JWO22_2752, partial [Frankiales bacterium]|nr:hypothetical protein [Frankiales bacterium]